MRRSEQRLQRRDMIRNRRVVIKEKKEHGILLSILIPTLFSRRKVFNNITDKLMKQIEENKLNGLVELISHFDNKTVGLSFKRTNMLRTAGGKFIAYLDDDDDVADTYIKDIIDAIRGNLEADIITFKQHCNCDGEEFDVISGLEHSLNGSRERGKIFRYPWIWCIWKRENVIDIDFKDPGSRPNYGEDRYWLERIIKSGKIRKEIKINKTLHYYLFSSKLTETQKTK